jgi:Flp pilus assembly protein TadB
VGLGSLAWALAALVLLVVGDTGTGFVVCVVGAVLGGIGYGVFRWQRSAARRGSRTAQQGLR